MLEIEIRKPRDGVCNECRGTGIVIPRRTELPLEVGEFCLACGEGAARWEATLKLVSDFDSQCRPAWTR